jgi:hypothetical protein
MTAAGGPKAAPFTKNCTVPFGSCDASAIALLCVAIVAVMVTFVLGGTVVWLAETEVVVAACVTVTTSVAEALPLKLMSPA